MLPSEIKLFAYNLAIVEDSISIIHRCQILTKKDVIGFLIVNSNISNTPKDKKFITVAFNADLREGDDPKEFLEVTPEEYKDIIKEARKLPEGWVLKEVLFEGIYIFEDMDSLISSIQEWPYSVQLDDDPMLKNLGFRCKSGRKWQIKSLDYKRTISTSKLMVGYSFKDLDQKNLFLQFLNTKPFYTPKEI